MPFKRNKFQNDQSLNKQTLQILNKKGVCMEAITEEDSLVQIKQPIYVTQVEESLDYDSATMQHVGALKPIPGESNPLFLFGLQNQYPASGNMSKILL